MATFTLTQPRIFPDDTDLDLYVVGEEPAGATGRPTGVILQTKTVADGAATFTNLDEGEEYLAAGEVSSTWRRVRFTVPTPTVDERLALLEQEIWIPSAADLKTGVSFNYWGDAQTDSTIVFIKHGDLVHVQGQLKIAEGNLINNQAAELVGVPAEFVPTTTIASDYAGTAAFFSLPDFNAYALGSPIIGLTADGPFSATGHNPLPSNTTDDSWLMVIQGAYYVGPSAGLFVG